MWDKLAAQVAVEFEQLERLLGTYRPLLQRCRATPPDDIELAALGTKRGSVLEFRGSTRKR